jgi:hypothetical protein
MAWKFWRNFRRAYSADMDAHNDLDFKRRFKLRRSAQKASKHCFSSSGSTTGSSSGDGAAESSATSKSETDIPIFFPAPFQEPSTVRYYSIEERLRNIPNAPKTTADLDHDSPEP